MTEYASTWYERDTVKVVGNKVKNVGIPARAGWDEVCWMKLSPEAARTMAQDILNKAAEAAGGEE